MSKQEVDVTIVVPTLNEADNVAPLTKRIDATMKQSGMPYSILFIDDHSSDGTTDKIDSLAKYFPVSYQTKQGDRGKAQSIIQGFEAVKSRFMCMIDADLQYPPEDIPKMVNKLVDNNADVALSQRLDSEAGAIRNLMTKTFHFFFIQSLFGINYDTQSGLKVMKTSAYSGMQLTPSQWSFDLEFIVASLQRQSKILTHDIKFGSRNSGEAKINVIKSSFELAKSSIQLRTKVSRKNIRRAYNMNAARFSGVTGAN